MTVAKDNEDLRRFKQFREKLDSVIKYLERKTACMVRP